MQSMGNGEWRFDGEIGRRVDVNIDQWLLRAPQSSPGLLDMFRRRDRRLHTEPLVPWAGEFAGKHLISAVQACQMSNDPRLRPFVQEFVDALVACQADNGYLGAFSEDQQLLGNWDLWNHYHIMTGLLMWYDLSGDQAAFDAAIKAADLICDIYGAGGRRPIEAGAPECNLAVMTVMLDLYRRTENPRYRELTLRIEEDMEQAGDWLRLGAAGTPYYLLPNNGTRWESLHIVQGFAGLYELTGKAIYRDAAVRLWESIRGRDRHPSGAFATHERAYGSPYAEGSIETCCSIAWAALSIDVLRLTGDSRVADELEMTTWNQFLAAQHPSGSWCTYDNPINGTRIPSFHAISFQFRPGTAELNCCSVNAPRGLGMLPTWAIMNDDTGAVINFYGPMKSSVVLNNGEEVAITQTTDYPLDGSVKIEIAPSSRSEFSVRLRVPAWSANTSVAVNGERIEDVQAGRYLVLNRAWEKGDQIELEFDMGLRYWAGEANRRGQAALYAGPLLLAFDEGNNPYDASELPPIDLAKARLVKQERKRPDSPWQYAPMGLWEVKDADPPIVLSDFASAGAQGTLYNAWLPVVHAGPPPIWLEYPPNGAAAAPGPVGFKWTAFGASDDSYELIVARDPAFENPVLHLMGLTQGETLASDAFVDDGVYYWKVTAENPFGRQQSRPDHFHFIIDSSLDRPFEISSVMQDADAMKERLAPFEPTGGAIILGVKSEATSYDKEDWLEFENPNSIDGVGFFSPAKDSESMFSWSLTSVPAGKYQLDAWIPHDPHADHATNASYRIHHSQGDTEVEVDLTNSVFRWHHLGEFAFDAASRVEVSNLADRYVVVEGIRLRPVEP